MDVAGTELRAHLSYCNTADICSTSTGPTSNCFTRDLEDAGKGRATIACRLCTICGFYRYAE